MTLHLSEVSIVIALLMAHLSAASGADQVPQDVRRFLSERNIFRQDRGRAAERAHMPRETPPPERFVILRGVVQLSRERVAFLEDTRKGNTIKAKVGDPVLDGRLKEITVDSVIYVAGDRTVDVGIGKTLEGGQPSSIRGPEVTAVKAEAAPGSQPPDKPNGVAAEASPEGAAASEPAKPASESDVLTRMMQRRKAEAGK